MTKSWKYAIAGALAVVLSGTGLGGSSVLAGQVPAGPDPQAGRFERMGRTARGPRAAFGLGVALGQLGLTDDQWTQIRTIQQEHRDELRLLGQRARTTRRGIDQAVAAQTVDEGAIRAAVAAWGEVETDMALLRARMRAQVMQVLTPEQRAKAETLKAQARQRAEQRALRMRERRQAQPAPAPPPQP
jgi:Spy/CpxP family protein refolding chaperone